MNKKYIITAAVLLFMIVSGLSQTAAPVVKKEKLSCIQFVSEITPALWPKLLLPYKERSALDQLSRMAYSESFIYPNKYNTIIDYVSVEISATCYGKTLTAQSLGDALTIQQKNILSSVDIGTDIRVKIKFKYKAKSISSSETNIIEGELAVTVVPEVEAEFPGGYLKIRDYLRESLTNKIPKVRSVEALQQASVKFIVNEEGRVVDARIDRTSKNKIVDKLLLEATTNMPKWKPAKNSKGVAVKQEFHVQLGSGC